MCIDNAPDQPYSRYFIVTLNTRLFFVWHGTAIYLEKSWRPMLARYMHTGAFCCYRGSTRTVQFKM